MPAAEEERQRKRRGVVQAPLEGLVLRLEGHVCIEKVQVGEKARDID